MNTDTKQLALEAARALEKGGDVDGAVRQFLRAGAIEEAARVLAAAKRFSDAGHLVMDSLGVGAALVGGLDVEKKKLVMKAAVCFAQGGETKRAIELFIALGDPLRAADVAERAGDKAEAARIRARVERRSASGIGAEPSTSTSMSTLNAAGKAAAQRLEAAGQLDAALAQYVQLKAFSDAARVAYRLKRKVDAAQLFEDAGMAFEAAACFAEAGETGRCLEAVVRVPRDHPKYRTAAVQAIRLASDLGVLDFKLDHFLGAYVSEGPKEERDLEAFYVLAKLYRARDFLENAREAYRKILAARPGGYRDVAQKLAQLDEESKGSRMAYEQIVREEAAFRGDARQRMASHASLPELPDLPDLPPPPPITSPRSQFPPSRQSSHDLSGAAAASQNILARSATMVRPGVPPPSAASAAPAVAAAPPGSMEPLITGDLPEGAIISERYRIEQKIGQGGMASVYRATDLELGEQIAMKLFLQPSDDQQLLQRFKQELTLSRNLAHPNIVRLYDIGIHQGCRFITMELLEGTDLGALIEGKPLEMARGINYLIQACAGLALAHEKGVIHRDIKPANFFVTKEDVLKVMDFGIAKKSTAQQGMTVAGFIAGTPAYMSPEQINNFAAVSYRTDIYALGCVAYELFTGAVPFDHDQMMQLLMMHLTQAPEPPRSRNPDIPQELEDIILRLLEKDPDKRVQSCVEIGEMLKELQVQPRRAALRIAPKRK